MGAMASQITVVSTVCSVVCSGADQRKHRSFAWLVFLRGIHRSPVDSPHKGPVTRKMFPFDDVIMKATQEANGSAAIPWIDSVTTPTYDRWPDTMSWAHYCGVSNHQTDDCLLNHLSRRRSKKTSKLRVVRGVYRSPVNSPHKWPVTRKMFPFYDVIMPLWLIIHYIYRIEYTTHQLSFVVHATMKESRS